MASRLRIRNPIINPRWLVPAHHRLPSWLVHLPLRSTSEDGKPLSAAGRYRLTLGRPVRGQVLVGALFDGYLLDTTVDAEVPAADDRLLSVACRNHATSAGRHPRGSNLGVARSVLVNQQLVRHRNFYAAGASS